MIRHIPRCCEIDFISHEHPWCILVFFEQILPHFHVLKRGLPRHIIDKDGALCVFEISGDKTAISLLSRSVPHLQPVKLPITGNVSYVEIDADC